MTKRRNTAIPAVLARDVVSPLPIAGEQLLTDLRALIDSARQRVAQTMNADLVLMYWRVGTRIRQDILAQERDPNWRADSLYTVETIDHRLLARLQPPES